MKPSFFRAAGTLVVATLASTALAGPRWSGSISDPFSEELVGRCALDPLSTDAARERDNWALQCDVVTKKWKTLFNYEFNDDGEPILRPQPLYPSFGAATGSTHYL